MVTGSREVETKYDVGVDSALPDLSGIGSVARVSKPERHELDATYFDTEDLRLARAGITLRRRAGGDDEGWHLKLPVDDARHELRAPLGRTARTPPIALRRIVAGVVGGEAVVPVACLRTERHVVSLFDDDDTLLALLCDDRVRARRLASEDEDELVWREWELELLGGSKKLAKKAYPRLREAWARRSAHGSKLARALDTSWVVPVRPSVDAGKHTSERDLLHQHLAALTADMTRLDPLVRADLPDAVHQLRVSCRRLRGILSTFAKSFDPSSTDPVREDLRWVIRELGRARDLEVLRARVAEMFAAEEPGLVRGQVRRWTDSQLRTAHRAAHKEAVTAMESPRYSALVDTLGQWAGTPPWSGHQDKPARAVLRKPVAREWARIEKAVAAAEATQGTEEHVGRLHDVRRAAKHTRYAAEALAPVIGPAALRFSSAAEAIQSALGDHHDTAVTATQLVALADAAHAAGQDTFILGVLRARLDAELVANERAYEKAWSRAGKPRLRDWLG